MAGLEIDSYHEHEPTPQGFIDPQRRYNRQRYAVDVEAAMNNYTPQDSGRASSDLAPRDDKMNNWESNMKGEALVPDGNSEVVLLDHSGKGSGNPTPAIHRFEDPDIVTWDGPNDPQMATNWPLWRKYMTSLILSLFTFIAPFSALMLTPALDVIGEDINIPAGAQRTLLTSLPLLANGLGPLFWAPIMEKVGRVPIIRYSHVVHIIFNTACGFAQTGPQLLAFRFLSALGACAPNIIAPGLTAETYPPAIGGTGDTMHAMLPFIGKAGAPIVGAFAAQSGDWRWIFWGTSMFSVFALAMTVFLRETYPPVILERKAKRLRKETGNPHLRTEYVDPSMPTQTWLGKKAALPLVMLFTFPCVQLPFTYRGYLFGVLTLIISIFERTFKNVYSMDTLTASLNYFSLMAGFVTGLQLSCKVINASTNYLTKKTGKPHQPEFRVPPQLLTAILVPTGLLVFGWGTENGLHYVVPNVAAFIMSVGFILGFFSLQPYVTDSVGLEYASSAHSIAVLLQSIFEFSFTLFGAPMVDGIGLGLSSTLLALGTISVAVPMPFILWYLGPKLRSNKKGIPVPAVKYPL